MMPGSGCGWKRNTLVAWGILLPIKGEFAATDALISQVVYRLYGLAKEAIGIVEGRV